MGVTVGSARIDEKGGATGGKAGDQKNGFEVSTQAWYKHSKGWRVLRAKKATVRDALATAMKAACANNHIGYDQSERNTLYNLAEKVQFNIAKVTKDCETDCSALVRVCLAYAGITGLPSSMRTTNMCSIILGTGEFVELTGSKYTDKSDYLCHGDILCTKTQGHTVIVLNDGSKVESNVTGDSEKHTGSVVLNSIPVVDNGDTGFYVGIIQKALLAWDESCLPKYGADSDFGDETEKAVKAFQKAKNIESDGVVGEDTWNALMAYIADKVGVTGSTVNLRSFAGTDGIIIGIAHKGDEMSYIETAQIGSTTWYRTLRGWISGKYAKENQQWT